MDLEPVPDTPALRMRGGSSWVCVADLHLGMESELRRAGFNIPTQTPKMLAKLKEIASPGDRLLVLGDVKHRIPWAGYREDREIRPFFSELQRNFDDVVVMAGNHDGGITEVLPDGVKASSGRGDLVEDVGVFHGHLWPSDKAMSGKKLVMGHIHPAVVLVDSIGTRSTEKCWLRAKLNRDTVMDRYKRCPAELVVLPAFNPLLTGTPVNTTGGSKLGPIFKNELVDRTSYRVYLLDGTNLGTPEMHAPRKPWKRS